MPTDFSQLKGWTHRPDIVGEFLATLAKPTFALAAPHLVGDGAGKTTLLYKAFDDLKIPFPEYPAQQVGCCVGRGWKGGIETLEAVQIATGKKAEAFKPTSHEVIYGLSRVDIGGGQMGSSDGSVGAWAAKAVSTIGTVAQEDVGPMSDKTAASFGYYGVPAEIKAKASAHQAKTVSLVENWDQLCDAMANGYPVPVCSNQGFTMTRDAQGFCRPKGTWGHCMLLVAVKNDSRPGACCVQSWGPDTPDGPLSLGQPSNSFWIDQNVVESMLAMQDSFAVGGFDGYPGQALPSHWSYAGFA